MTQDKSKQRQILMKYPKQWLFLIIDVIQCVQIMMDVGEELVITAFVTAERADNNTNAVEMQIAKLEELTTIYLIIHVKNFILQSKINL